MTDTMSNVLSIDTTVATNGHGVRSPLTIWRLSPENPSDWALLPVLLERARQFIDRLDLLTPFPAMSMFLRAHWSTGSQQIALWVGMRDGEMVGHAIGIIQEQWGLRHATFVQVDLDRDAAPMTRAQLRWALADMDAWTQSQGVTVQRMLTKRSPEVWKRITGYELEAYILKKEVR